MEKLLQSIDGLEMISNGWIRSTGNIMFAKNRNHVQKVSYKETKKKKTMQVHSMQVVDSRREIKSTADCILEKKIEITKDSNLFTDRPEDR